MIVDEPEKDVEREKLTLQHYKRIFCITIGYQFDIKNIIRELRETYQIENSEYLNRNVVNIKFLQPHIEKNIFIFDYGVVCIWGFDDEEKNICEIFFRNCQILINSEHIKNNHSDENVFYYKKGEVFHISNRNKIIIESNSLYERLSVTYALAQDTILRYYETDVGNAIEETKKIPIEMRD